MKTYAIGLLFVVLAMGISFEGLAGSISGTVSYTGSATGTIVVVAFADTTMRSNPAMYAAIDSPGAYTMSNLADGTYYLVSFMTHSFDMVNVTDPWGWYGTAGSLSGVIISGNNNVTGVNISLADGSEQNPNPFHREYIAPAQTISLPGTVLAGVNASFAYDGSSIYMYKHDTVDAAGAHVYKIDPGTGGITTTTILNLQSSSNGISWIDCMVFQGSTIWTTGGYGDPLGTGGTTGIFQSNLSNSTSSHQIPVALNWDLRSAIACDNVNLYVIVDSGSTYGIVKFDPLQTSLVGRPFLCTVPIAPRSMCFADGYLWVGLDSLEQFDPVTGIRVAGYNIPSPAAGLYFDGKFWMYDESTNTLYGFSLTPTGVADGKPSGLPADFALSQNYPNPFNPSTNIRFALPRAADVSLVVFDVLGREVAVLAKGHHEAGVHTATWNASHAASGVYFARLTARDELGNLAFSKVNKLVLTK